MIVCVVCIVKSNLTILADRLAQSYLHACLAEVEAIKPGNVHIFADGHGMVVEDFIRSGEASMRMIAMPDFTLGERIYHTVEATWQALAMNTNLGIVLLCAPIVHAVLHAQQSTLPNMLAEVLASTSQADAEFMFAAIRLAHPAGLGHSEQHDVNQVADCSLLQAMQFAATRDTIALQYAHAYQEIFEIALTCYQQHLQRWQRPAWATTAMYLKWLATFNDSHVQRKFGLDVADSVRFQAQAHFAAFTAQENPKIYLPSLLAFDQLLKTQGINPGTSADLTVATLLMYDALTMVDN